MHPRRDALVDGREQLLLGPEPGSALRACFEMHVELRATRGIEYAERRFFDPFLKAFAIHRSFSASIFRARCSRERTVPSGISSSAAVSRMS